MNSTFWVNKLNLLPHPEGGFYKETYRSKELVNSISLNNKKVERPSSTAIYFLLTKGNFSAFHRIASDEMWHFYHGDPLVVHVIHPTGDYEKILLGNEIDNNCVPQALVPAKSWFASESLGQYSLVGCTVAPGFDFEDFELAKQEELSTLFPAHRLLISRLCRI